MKTSIFENKKVDREKQAEYLMKFIYLTKKEFEISGEKMKIKDIFSNEKNKREFIDKIEYKEFKELLERTNKILLGDERSEKNNIVENNAIINTIKGEINFIPPQFKEDKEYLLKYTLDIAKEMNRDNRSLEDIGLALNLSIYFIHPFEDRNAGTSKFFNTMILDDFNKKETRERIKKMLSKKEILDIDNDLFIDFNFAKQFIDLKIEQRIFKNKNLNEICDFSYKKEDDLKKGRGEIIFWLVKNDFPHGWFSILDYLKDKPKEYINKYIEIIDDTAPEDYQEKKVNLNKLFDDLDDVSEFEILNKYKEIKKEFVKKSLDIVVNPEDNKHEKRYVKDKLVFKIKF